jgi:nucleoside-diphosphate-sugar epimerase
VTSRRVLITGGAGFLGAQLVSRFHGDGARVRVMDLHSWDDPGCAAPDELMVGDVRDPAAAGEACRDVDVVVHSAFASPRESRAMLRSVNVEGTRCLLETARARGVRRVVLISSTIVDWASRTHPIFPDAPLSRLDAYRASRVEAERIALDYGRRGLSIALVRPKTFIGPGRTTAFALLFELIRRGQSVPVLGDGRHRYQLLDIRDFADGVRALAWAGGGGVFCFGATRVATVREELEALIASAGTGARLRFIPRPLARGLLRVMELAAITPLSEWHYRGARGEDSVVDISRAEAELGWHPARSNLQTLEEAYRWYVEEAERAGAAPPPHPIPLAHRGLKGLSRLWSRWR